MPSPPAVKSNSFAVISSRLRTGFTPRRLDNDFVLYLLQNPDLGGQHPHQCRPRHLCYSEAAHFIYSRWSSLGDEDWLMLIGSEILGLSISSIALCFISWDLYSPKYHLDPRYVL